MTAVVDLELNRTSLAEDLGLGDVTSPATVPEGKRGSARVIARSAAVVCGLAQFRAVFAHLDEGTVVELGCADGDLVPVAHVVATIEGSLVSILEGERVALNFLGRMSGIATTTRAYVDALADGSETVIVDTRKTTPGHRALERYAVRCGGGHNHRPRLDGGVLIKENHIAAAGSIATAVARARQMQGPALRIEVEVRNLEELEEALAARAEVVMLDNMDIPTVKRAVDRAKGKTLLEVSGGITPDKVGGMSALGVEFISVGSLTHSAPWADLSLLIDRC